MEQVVIMAWHVLWPVDVPKNFLCSPEPNYTAENNRPEMSISYRRPAFWRVPAYVEEDSTPIIFSPPISPQPPPAICTNRLQQRRRSSIKKHVHFADEPITEVQVGSPAYGEVLRGDIISKIGEYDARDLSHADAQHLFRSAGNEIKLVVHRDNKIAYTQGVNQEPSSRSNSTLPSTSPDLLNVNQQQGGPHRGPSPFLPGPGHYERALELPVDTLPHTVFPKLNASGGYVAPSENASFSPMPTRDHQQDVAEEQSAIVNQPYRTTPLVLPGAKVKKDAPTTESYLRHYPNPAVRAHPGHDYHDSIMKQRVADTMLHKVVGPDADSGRVFHKQFNSPIGLYSDSNIENTIRQTVPCAKPENRVRNSPLHRPLPTKLDGYKQTVVYDPRNSDTYRAIQEEGYGYAEAPREVTVPVQTKVYQPNKLVPGKKLSSAPISGPSYNVVNTHDETIRQSGSFNRLMYSVLGASNY